MFRVSDLELCESRDGRPGLPVPNKPYGFCGRKATFKRGGGGGETEQMPAGFV